jgi:DnaJ-class molecular chaperone
MHVVCQLKAITPTIAIKWTTLSTNNNGYQMWTVRGTTNAVTQMSHGPCQNCNSVCSISTDRTIHSNIPTTAIANQTITQRTQHCM